MVTWRIVYTKQAQKDAKMITAAELRQKAEKLLLILSKNLFQTQPRYEKLRGDLSGAYSRRINIHHRLVYQVISEVRTVKVIRMWTHCE